MRTLLRLVATAAVVTVLLRFVVRAWAALPPSAVELETVLAAAFVYLTIGFLFALAIVCTEVGSSQPWEWPPFFFVVLILPAVVGVALVCVAIAGPALWILDRHTGRARW